LGISEAIGRPQRGRAKKRSRQSYEEVVVKNVTMGRGGVKEK